ncbi:hypothetical protein Ahy_B10g105767 [Arachis hypogaea]|uniref:Transposase MuDR plant domain-containing protein n=1 Tax=Arachis hypogaea TaxID=3818 RepID=A0A444X8U0_ARAHY|nr:hypothetical protein Ahy_B10g105767 [Arachis hypogaea]
MAACSSSMPVGISSSVPVIVPETAFVATPSFAADLNRNHDGEIGDTRPFGELAIAMAGTPDVVPVSEQGRVSNGVEDVLRDDDDDDDDDDDVELDTIADDSDDNIARSNPAGVVERLVQELSSTPALFNFGLRCHETAGEEAVLSVKTYSIRRGVECKVLESDYRKYYGKYKEFGNGCTWLIRISFCQRRGILEVKRYNRSHTCLTTLISSDHRMLDYHVISAFILPMIRADAIVSIKVLLNATEAHFDFRLTYKRVWLAK